MHSKMFLNIFLLVLIAVLGLGVFYINNQSSSQKKLTQTASETRPEKTSTSNTCTGIPTTEQTEGPYYKANTPEQNNIAEGITGVPLIVKGYVFDKNCQPVANAWLDFWQADSQGNYDNDGYSLRGHQYTDTSGQYRLETIVPAEYPGRPPHIHVKVRATSEKLLTSQMYFPGAERNATDSIFDETLLMNVFEAPDGKAATFHFVLKD